MRISDWSSDVCSSDLVELSLNRQVVLSLAIINQTVTECRRVGVDCTQLLHAGNDPPGHVHIKFSLDEGLIFFGKSVQTMGLGQIGRAQCRERVCQYVYISVVAVTLKKKNTKKN